MKFKFDENVVVNHCRSVLIGVLPQDKEAYETFANNLDPQIVNFITIIKAVKDYNHQYSAGVMDGIFLVLKSIEAKEQAELEKLAKL